MPGFGDVFLHATVDVARAVSLVATGAEPVLTNVVAAYTRGVDVEDSLVVDTNVLIVGVVAERLRSDGESSFVDIIFSSCVVNFLLLFLL
jgi:hypothetical protein